MFILLFICCLFSLSSRFLFSIAFDFLVFLLLSLSMTFFLNMFLGFLQFFVCVPFCWAFLHIYVFLLVSHFFLFKIVSIFVFILLCFWTFSFFVSFLEHFYFLCVSLFNIVYFLNVSLFWRLVDHPFSALFLFSLFYIFTFFLSEKTKLVSVFTVFFETRNGVAQLFLFFSFSKKYSLMFSPSSCFSILWKRLFYWRFVFAHFETSFFYLHFFSHQKYVQHFPFRNVSFTSLIPPFVHPLSTCSFFLFLRVFVFLSPIFRPTQKFPCLLVSLCFLYL